MTQENLVKHNFNFFLLFFKKTPYKIAPTEENDDKTAKNSTEKMGNCEYCAHCTSNNIGYPSAVLNAARAFENKK